jgi:uncharacterized membrane protein YcaP (DUF421 family)
METIWRVAVVYLFIVFGLRVLGKREFGQLSPLELVTLLIIPEIVSQALVQEDFSLTGALVGVSTLFVLVYLSSLLQHKSKAVEQVFSSSPSVLVQDGKFVEEQMNKERVSPDEIFEALFMAGFDRLEQVKWAILGSDGKIAIVPAVLDGGVQQQQREGSPVL